jgi:succinate dehydrogenase/fumarate reductase flavoprotein subunit
LQQTKDYDVIVVGTGVAGHCAALEAVEAGARVLMLDAEDKIGGSTNLSSGILMGANTRYQRSQGILDDTPEKFYHHYVTANHWQVQPSVARRLCFEAGKTIDWLEARGVSYLKLMGSGDEERPRGHVTAGGDTIVLALHGRIQKTGRADVALNTRVDRLLVNEDTVVGISAGGQEVSAGAVVLATGGMGANLDLVARWTPAAFTEGAQSPRYLGGPGARGDALRLTAELGAQVLPGRGLNTPIWAFGAGYLPSYMVIVNTLGRRFMDETLAYGMVEAIFASQPGSAGYVIFDDVTKRAMVTSADVFRETKAILPGLEPAIGLFTSAGVDDLVAGGQMIKADTLAQLAFRIGAPAENLRGTIERYNRHAANGHDDDYLKPAKLLRPVATGPFYAFAMHPAGFAVTTTGLRIDHDACVIRNDSLAIPGLFAGGECTGGVLVKVYVGSGNALASASTFGRVAGRNAAAYAANGAVPLIDWATVEANPNG